MTKVSALCNFNCTSSNHTIEDSELHLADKIGLIVRIILTIFTCPLTVLLNILVILAVKKRPRLQSKPNILLACLAATDAFIGLTILPAFILFETFKLFGNESMVQTLRLHFLDRATATGIVNSLLHLMLVTFERLVAIKFTIHYPFIITEKNIKICVSVFWAIALSTWGLRYITSYVGLFSLTTVLSSCVIFITISYVILYRETLRHKKRIKAQLMNRQERERFLREKKAFKTTVLVVGAVVLCFIPAILLMLSILVYKLPLAKSEHFSDWARMFATLNSLLNPLIYFWREKEMRNLALTFFTRNASVNPQD
ncbi:lysophosphatidic acid receptor 3-like [Montipora foliosa]|uniref:lysophosphatidic acid receptor 3-like n=1 Tax=Montipora foliosa TaxID=591990 RepID=UPI0035F1F928